MVNSIHKWWHNQKIESLNTANWELVISGKKCSMYLRMQRMKKCMYWDRKFWPNWEETPSSCHEPERWWWSIEMTHEMGAQTLFTSPKSLTKHENMLPCLTEKPQMVWWWTKKKPENLLPWTKKKWNDDDGGLSISTKSHYQEWKASPESEKPEKWWRWSSKWGGGLHLYS